MFLHLFFPAIVAFDEYIFFTYAFVYVYYINGNIPRSINWYNLCNCIIVMHYSFRLKNEMDFS